MAAALRLAGAGCEVVLLERRPFLGGRAFSFHDPETGAVIDNGQHVLVGACRRLRAFLEEIGSPEGAFARQRSLSIPIIDGSGRRAALAAAPLPAPLHLVPALLRYRHLSLRDRLAIARDARALSRRRDRSGLEDLPLGEWLAGRGASRAAIERFWEPLVTPALNVRVSEANVPLTGFFLERALWGGAGEGALWLPQVGLSEAIGEPGQRALEAAGIDVRLGARATGVAIESGRTCGVELAADRPIACDMVVCALPPRELDAVLPSGPGYDRLGAAPIVNAYLWYDRSVATDAFAGTFGSPLQWIFDRESLLGSERSGGPCLGVSLSAAEEWVGLAKAEIAGRLDEAVARVLPRRSGAQLVGSAVVKEPRATFRATAGCGRLRPGPRGPAEGLWLAGDWTDTGWPATMEGAVRSGEHAAAAALAALLEPSGSAAREPGR
jgi:squalene-associated FAD-dependent desaturase